MPRTAADTAGAQFEWRDAQDSSLLSPVATCARKLDNSFGLELHKKGLCHEYKFARQSRTPTDGLLTCFHRDVERAEVICQVLIFSRLNRNSGEK